VLVRVEVETANQEGVVRGFFLGSHIAERTLPAHGFLLVDFLTERAISTHGFSAFSTLVVFDFTFAAFKSITFAALVSILVHSAVGESLNFFSCLDSNCLRLREEEVKDVDQEGKGSDDSDYRENS